MWCVAKVDEQYQRRMEDVLELYERPLDEKEPVVCLDEKSVTLRAEVRKAIPAEPGRVARRDSEYERRGTAHVFCAVEPKAGRHLTWPTANRRGPQFAEIIRQLVGQYPNARTIHLVMDNLNTHSRKPLRESFGEQDSSQIWARLTPHYTPKHGSWLNQAEIEVGLFSRQCLGQRRIPDLTTLEHEAQAWNDRVNQQRTVIDWTFSREAARKKFPYGSNEISGSEH